MLEIHSQFVCQHVEGSEFFRGINPFFSFAVKDGRAQFSSYVCVTEVDALIDLETALCKALDECRRAISYHTPNDEPSEGE